MAAGSGCALTEDENETHNIDAAEELNARETTIPSLEASRRSTVQTGLSPEAREIERRLGVR